MADRQTDKTTRWSFTAYKEQWKLFEIMPDKVAEWGWQTEICPQTQREHYQGFLRTRVQVRMSALISMLPGVHFEVCRNWNALLAYCKKTDTAVEGTRIHQMGAKALTMKDALTRLAGFQGTTVPIDDYLSHGIKNYEEWCKVDYWSRVNKLLRDDPDTIGLWVNPAFLTAWKHTRRVWLEQSELEASLSITARPLDATTQEMQPGNILVTQSIEQDGYDEETPTSD